MTDRLSTYVVTREDRSQDPVTFVAEGLAIGRLADCEVSLNHPTVSRLHAGVREIDGHFYVFHLSPSNSTTLNGSLVEEKAALADGDLLQIGPFFLSVGIEGDALTLRVSYQPAVRIGDVESRAATHREASAPVESVAALDLFWEKRKREAGKVSRPSALRPRTATRLGKTRHNWKPTRDLNRPYPFALFTWALVAVGLLTAVAAFGYTNAFAPAPLSDAHARASLAVAPSIARQPNANSCTTCHSVSRTMNESCASCHSTEAFDAKTSDAHVAAGIGCTACHAEHRGRDFRASVAPLSADFQPRVSREETCAGCHADANKKTYNGRAVHTPHGGTFGYPVANGQWTWKGLSYTETRSEPEEVRKLLSSVKATSEDERRSVEFHALHLHRVRAVAGIKGNEAGELTCSSCHKSLGASLDRATPRTTCIACHGGLSDERTGRAIIPSNAPNCVSCHAQHTGDARRWAASLLVGRQ
ncbi:MAG: hypothetical protein QOE33_1661 [Acidobacteriota bacterium]|nr:hypothetical protein [Acidobacteriota bacterium]